MNLCVRFKQRALIEGWCSRSKIRLMALKTGLEGRELFESSLGRFFIKSSYCPSNYGEARVQRGRWCWDQWLLFANGLHCAMFWKQRVLSPRDRGEIWSCWLGWQKHKQKTYILIKNKPLSFFSVVFQYVIKMLRIKTAQPVDQRKYLVRKKSTAIKEKKNMIKWVLITKSTCSSLLFTTIKYSTI